MPPSRRGIIRARSRLFYLKIKKTLEKCRGLCYNRREKHFGEANVKKECKKEWFFDRFCGTQLVVYTEDRRIVEVGVESDRGGDLLGNIYKGRVMNVVPGMQAAFVNCGMERNCYLPLDEGPVQLNSYDGAVGSAVRRTLKEGDEVLVQVEKLPRGSKGAKVTCGLSFVGKTLIYLPNTDFLGISRKITDPAIREALLKEADKLRDSGQGFIVRTAAENATKRHIKTESEYLKRIYRSVLEAARTAPVGTAVYREWALPVKVMRDSLGGVSGIYVGDRELYERVLHLARMRSDIDEKKVVLHTGERSMFSDFGLSEQVYELSNTHVPLENGGYLVIDVTEAMTVIDVNTGKYTGDTDLENTVFHTNLQAAREIARQVRLRNIGGIVAVDFIDMADEAHRAAVDEELARVLSEDRSKCRTSPMNELCVALFTRKRTNNELKSFMLKPCPHCTREGYVLSDLYMAMRIRSEIIDTFAKGYRSVILELNHELMERIFSEGYFKKDVEGGWRGRRIYLVGHRTFHEEKYTVRGDNSPVLTLPDTARLLY